MKRRDFVFSLSGLVGTFKFSSSATVVEELKEVDLEVRGMT